MKIYISHSTNFDFKSELYEPIRTSTINSEHQVILPHETNQFINSKEIIKQSDVVVAEVSYPSTGEGIELGWTSVAGTPVICVYKEGSKISSSLKSVCNNFITYKNSVELIEKLTTALLTIKDGNH